MIGKTCAGKLHARFDEGELEIRLRPLRQLSTLPFIALASSILSRTLTDFARNMLHSQGFVGGFKFEQIFGADF